ncbi:helix-turn-helix domain-containing protein [Acidaminobacter sp. JC074]|uniref:helix-turn-helix domain-containing protein n=1 Tax=Acidaminobacter sp. JC074 TaxID=2530199 RepID=UPI001F0E171E|nr:helix-turn-helix domain-containing protein [Acidaminobacter sp. JC074]MCH4890103.1 helix-turn-helix domain-containing protein [Acidaminobacter sp. JC074]
MIDKKSLQEIKVSQRIKQTIDMMKQVTSSKCLVVDRKNQGIGDLELIELVEAYIAGVSDQVISNKLHQKVIDNQIYILGQYTYKDRVIGRYAVGPLESKNTIYFENLKLIVFNLSRLQEEIEPEMDLIDKSDIPFEIITAHENYEFLEVLNKLLEAFKVNDIEAVESYTRLFFDSFIKELEWTNRSYIKYYIMLYYGLLILMMLDNGYDLQFTGITVQRFIAKLHNIADADKLILYAQAHLNEYFLLGMNKKSKYHSKYVTDAFKYLQENMDEHITIDHMSNILGISKRHLSRLISEETGKTYTEAYNDFKIEHAKILLKHTRYNMVEIASRVGFNSQAYLSKQFKKRTGLTPSEYRNS